MNRRRFAYIFGGAVLGLGGASYLLSDKRNFERDDIELTSDQSQVLTPDETQILYLASLAPSGHNTQPWFVQYVEPYHWIIGNDRNKWLPAVDPTQRETILSIGAFIQNLEYAAESSGYRCNWNLLAETSQDERVIEVKLDKNSRTNTFDINKIKNRRTLRSNLLGDHLKKDDLEYLIGSESEFIHYLPFASKEGQFINEQTIEANRLQAYRDPAQQELAEWVRFSSKDAETHSDGLTTASLEIDGIAGWIVRNFYGKNDVMKADFRERGLENVREHVARSAGWILVNSRDSSVSALLEAGRRMQRLFLKVRDKNIAVHPMSQILEETSTKQVINQSIGMSEDIQFILRTGYVQVYPSPVSLRRPVNWFVRTPPV